MNYELLCLFHDNRIFAFEKKQASDDASSSSSEQNVLLDLLTTPKYRAMSAMYIIFRLLDNISLLLIFVLSIMNNGFTIPTSAEWALFSAIGLEVFYDVMLYTHKYWTLQRLSIHIGIVLYCVYAVIVAWKHSNGDYTPNELHTVIVVLSIRFFTFIIEECVDIAIDGELHNDLLKLQNRKDQETKDQETREHQETREDPERNVEQNEIDTSSLLSRSKFKSYMDVSNAVKMPQDVDYKGSFFAWGSKSVFTREVWTKDQFPRWLVYILCFLPFIVAFIILVLFIILCLVASLIPVILAYVLAAICHWTCDRKILKKKVKSSNFFKELTHF
jgi:hypothetical protein